MSDRKGKLEALALTIHNIDKGYLALIRDNSLCSEWRKIFMAVQSVENKLLALT